jgi:hypothetical protein
MQPSDLYEQAGHQVGFDLFFTSGYTRGLPAMVPIAMLYGTPEDAAAQISYLEKPSYPISHIEAWGGADCSVLVSCPNPKSGIYRRQS